MNHVRDWNVTLIEVAWSHSANPSISLVPRGLTLGSGQGSSADERAALDGVAVLAGRGWLLFRALEDRRALDAGAGGAAVTQRMQADAEDRSRGEAVHRDAFLCRLGGPAHLDGPQDRLVVL